MKINDFKNIEELETKLTVFSKKELSIDGPVEFYNQNGEMGFGALDENFVLAKYNPKEKELCFFDEAPLPSELITEIIRAFKKEALDEE